MVFSLFPLSQVEQDYRIRRPIFSTSPHIPAGGDHDSPHRIYSPSSVIKDQFS
jgi:hypothetical protein